MPIGTFVNAGTVIIGSLIGILLRKHFPLKIKQIVFQAIGLSTLVIGIKMSLEVRNILILIFSMLLGGITGEFLGLDKGLERLTDRIKKKFKSSGEHFGEGLVTAFLIFCVGSMTIVGALDEGLRADHTVLLTKSVLDGFTSIALASTYGAGVLFSFLPLLVFQGGITLLAFISKDFFTPVMISQMTAVGGAMILGLGINLLEIKKIRIINLLPALVYVVILTRIFQ